jgi:proto-oncogene tyrosine-protein kinase ROS
VSSVVGSQNEKITIKLGDFGLARELYFSDYYKLNGQKPLPIRCKLLQKLKEKTLKYFF